MDSHYKYVVRAVIVTPIFGINLRSTNAMVSLLLVLVVLDGYISSDFRALKMMNTYIAILLCIIAGTKLLFVFRDVVHGVLKKLGFDHNKTGKRVGYHPSHLVSRCLVLQILN